MQGKLLPHKAYWTKRLHSACPMGFEIGQNCLFSRVWPERLSFIVYD